MAKLVGFDERTAREILGIVRRMRRDVDILKRFRRRPVSASPWYQCWSAKITARSGATNATYSAEAFNDSTVAVSSATPINREFDTADITYTAADVYVDNDGGPDGMCLIVADHEFNYHLIAHETVTITDCGTEAATVVQPQVCYIRDNAGGISCTSTTWVEMTWDTQGRVDTGYYTHSTSTNPADITIEVTGDYKVTLEIGLELTSVSSFSGCECRMLVDGVEIDGTRSQAIARDSASDRDRVNLNTTIVHSFTGKEILTVEFRNNSESEDWDTIPDASRLLIEYID